MDMKYSSPPVLSAPSPRRDGCRLSVFFRFSKPFRRAFWFILPGSPRTSARLMFLFSPLESPHPPVFFALLPPKTRSYFLVLRRPFASLSPFQFMRPDARRAHLLHLRRRSNSFKRFFFPTPVTRIADPLPFFPVCPALTGGNVPSSCLFLLPPVLVPLSAFLPEGRTYGSCALLIFLFLFQEFGIRDPLIDDLTS